MVNEVSGEFNNYIKTSIPGFDELITKGIPKGTQVLISGGPGTMKTTFCLNLLVNRAKAGDTCLYLTFEEPEENLKRNMKEYGWDINGLIENGKLHIKNLDPFKMSRSVETLLAQARGELLIEINEAKNLIPEGVKPDIVVIDSLSAISAGFFGKNEGYRAYMSQIFETFRKLKLTSFLITEIEHNTTKYSKSGVEEFLADAVFALYNFRQGSQRLNAIEIIKVRGSEHKKKIVPFKAVKGQGIVVYPMEELFINEQDK
jgi:circadian clock protein KaiC